MNFGLDYINVFYHYRYDENNLSKVKRRMLLKQINTFNSSPFLCELMMDYTIDFIIVSSQYDKQFISNNALYFIQNFGSSFYKNLFDYKMKDKRLYDLKIRLLLLEKVY